MAQGILVPTSISTGVPCIARQIPNHWTPREVSPWLIHFLVRVLFLACQWQPSHCVFTGQGEKREELAGISSSKDTNCIGSGLLSPDLGQSVQLLSCVRLFTTPWTAAHQASLFITNSRRLLKLMSIELVMLPNHLILCHPLLLLPSIFPSIGVFSNESVLHIRQPKYWSFGINPSKEYSGLISFRMEWFDLLAVQGTLKSILQQFKNISSFVFSFLYGPTLTSIYNYWKNHSFD